MWCLAGLPGKKQIQELSDETPTDKVVPNEFQVKI